MGMRGGDESGNGVGDGDWDQDGDEDWDGVGDGDWDEDGDEGWGLG